MNSTPSAGTRTLHRSEDLVVGRGGNALLPACSQSFSGGDLWVIFGPNGSGKSTLLGTLAGLLRPVSGRHVIDVKARRSGMLQTTSISPLLPITVRGIVEAGVETGWSIARPKILSGGQDRADRWLGRLRLDSLASRSFHQLSGGQRQRAFLARTMASEPDIVLLDEPTSAMDREFMALSYALLSEYAIERKASVVVATHDLALGLPYADRAIFVDQDSNSLLVGTPQQLAEADAVQARYGNHLLELLRKNI